MRIGVLVQLLVVGAVALSGRVSHRNRCLTLLFLRSQLPKSPGALMALIREIGKKSPRYPLRFSISVTFLGFLPAVNGLNTLCLAVIVLASFRGHRSAERRLA